MSNTNELLEQLKELVFSGKSIVTCPLMPEPIPGIVTADAFDANDCLGTTFTIRVPKHGILYSASFFDMDDEGTQVDLEIFNHSITAQVSDSAFAPSNGDGLSHIDELNFLEFNDMGTYRISKVRSIGVAYTAPEGFLWLQAITRSTPTIAVGNMPRVQLQILSGDPDFTEM